MAYLRGHLDENLSDISVEASLLEHFTQEDGAPQGTHWSPATRGRRQKEALDEARHFTTSNACQLWGTHVYLSSLAGKGEHTNGLLEEGENFSPSGRQHVCSNGTHFLVRKQI